MKLVFDDRALEDLRRIADWIAQHDTRAADALVEHIFVKVERLTAPELIEMGRLGVEPGTRELVEYPYVIVYEVRDDAAQIVVLAIFHGAQDR